MMTVEERNELLRECEVELGTANRNLSELVESDDPIDDVTQEEIDCLMDTIVRLQRQYESLLQTL